MKISQSFLGSKVGSKFDDYLGFQSKTTATQRTGPMFTATKPRIYKEE